MYPPTLRSGQRPFMKCYFNSLPPPSTTDGSFPMRNSASVAWNQCSCGSFFLAVTHTESEVFVRLPFDALLSLILFCKLGQFLRLIEPSHFSNLLKSTSSERSTSHRGLASSMNFKFPSCVAEFLQAKNLFLFGEASVYVYLFLKK